jgi:hypothetical protein
MQKKSTNLYNVLFFIFIYTTIYGKQPATPLLFATTGYEKHIDLVWQQNKESDLSGYKIYRSEQSKQDFKEIKTIYGNLITVYLDWLSDSEKSKIFEYKITAINTAGEESAPTKIETAKLEILTDEQFLDMTQRATLRYFWDYAHPVSGMARERNANDDIVTTGGTGFGIMAILVGIERGYLTREQGLDRLVQITSFLQIADKFHGTFPHWMNGKTGNTIPFSQYDDGADLVETSFLMQGLLAARQFFDKNDPLENDLRSIISQLWEGVEYNWFRQGNANVLYWHWSPKYQWKMDFALRGFNEAHIVYILAKASPKYPIPTSLYKNGWASSNYVNGQTYYNYKLDVGSSKGGPLFFAHYSYLGFDPRNKKDNYCNYFTRNQAHTYINRAYCIENPKQFSNYSVDCWGLTASDTYNGYTAHEPNNDNGTISPTAALSSMPYSPKESLAALKHFYRTYDKKVFGEFGFYDAFNVTKNWYATSYLAIDQGPIIAMIENYRSGLLWKNFMKNPEIEPALKELGFVKDNATATQDIDNQYDINVFPNPISDNSLTLKMKFPKGANLSLNVLDFSGKEIKKVLQNQFIASKNWQYTFDTSDFPKGILVLQIIVNQNIIHKLIINN